MNEDDKPKGQAKQPARPPWVGEDEDPANLYAKPLNANARLTSKLLQQICMTIQMGTPPFEAGLACGVKKTTLNEWFKRGHRDINDRRTSIYAQFVDGVHRAVSIAAARAVGSVSSHMAKDWRAGAFFLERRQSKWFGRKESMAVELTGADGGPLEIKERREALVEVAMNPDLHDALLKIAAAMTPTRKRDAEQNILDVPSEDVQDVDT